MLDCDLAELYQVATKRLNEAVKRNAKRFPEDFMFQLNLNEFENWRSQIATSNLSVRMGVRRPPYAFTELGVAMISSVLNSSYAVEMNILIMRTFVKLREALGSHKELARRVDRIDAELRQHSNAITLLAGEIRQLRAPASKPSRRIGFLSAVSPRTI